MPVDADGTLVGQSTSSGSNGTFAPVTNYPTSTEIINWVNATASPSYGGLSSVPATVCFFPETRTVLGAIWALESNGRVMNALQGSNDTANGGDGTWEAASFASGYPPNLGGTSTSWRDSVKPCTFSAAKSAVRFTCTVNGDTGRLGALHLYGVKSAGQTPNDILFLDGDNAFAEYTVDKDFGDRPLGTTVVKQFKLKNSSATLTANTIVVTCNDADFAISNDGVTYGTTFTVTSLGAGVSSAVFYIRNTTPAPGAALGPRQVRLSAAVGSYT